MSDIVDQAQELEQAQREDALASHMRSPVLGRVCCADCGGAIAPLRTAIGAQRCIECQTAIEAEDRRVRRRG